MTMIIQEPIKATIWYALENYAYSDAIFLSERLYAEINTEENLYILATAYFRSGKQNIAYSILSNNKYNPLKSPNCHFLRAKCCLHLGKIEEATNLLLEPISNDLSSDKKFSKEDLTRVYGESSSFVAQILGQLFYKLEDFKLASHYYTLSLKINPFLWSSYEKLSQIDPYNVDQDKLFNMDNFDFKYSCGTNPLINLLNSTQIDMVSNEMPSLSSNNNKNSKTPHEDTGHYFVTPEVRKTTATTTDISKNRIELSTPYAILKQSSPCTNKVDVITPESDGQWKMMTCLAPTKNSRKFNSQNNSNPSSQVLIETSNLGANRNLNHLDSSLGHSFGVLSLDQDAINLLTNDQNTTSSKIDVSKSRNESHHHHHHHHHQDAQMIIEGDPMVMNHPIQSNASSILTRRSSRLINSDVRSIKENASSPASAKTIVDRRVTPVKRCRRTINFDKSNKLVEQNNPTSSKGISFDVTKTGVKAQRTSANGLIDLIKKFASAYKFLAEYRCRDAIECFKKLPCNHYNTGYVLSMIGRCYFEMGSYEEAINFFKLCRSMEPYRLQNLEIYSTALWHLQRELELSCLSQELIQFDKFAPETWCVAGNCFSLQKDHEISIKFLKRAIQVDPNFSYAYTLLGHELISADELDNAMSCFMNATRIDPRHYNAWCGIGLIYYKQEQFENASYHYKRALEISPHNPILMCHLAIVMHHLKKSREAIHLLNDASKLDPQNVLIKYHRASIRFSLKEHDQALTELEELRKIVPKESMIYFLTGKIHKIRGETHLAVMNFSWAVHIDPKGSANQHKEFTEPNRISADELIVHTGHADSSSASTATNTPFTQRSTYISGPINTSTNYDNIVHNDQTTSDFDDEFDDLMDIEINDDMLSSDDIESELSLESRIAGQAPRE